jgi:two-component system nitrate/nitrite sensor histidine kinase NarX
LAAGLASGDDLRDLMVRFLDPILQISGAVAGGVRALDGRDQQMHLVGDIGLPGLLRETEQSVEPDCGVCGVALASAQPAWAEDVGPCARRNGHPFFGDGCRRMLAVPLRHRGRVLGLLNLFFDGEVTPSPQVQALLKTVGELLGLALDNARLERETLRAAVLGERQALAAELHDSMGQSLTYVKMRLPLLQDALAAGDRAGGQRYFDDVRGAVSEAQSALRGILTHFRAPADPLGLAHALQVSVEAFRKQSSTVLRYENALPSLHLSPRDEAEVLLIVREALANVLRHARASHAWVTLNQGGSGVRVSIEDDGVGVGDAATDDAGNHYGLLIMRERAQRVHGTLSVRPRQGGGTQVQLELALPRPFESACASPPERG